MRPLCQLRITISSSASSSLDSLSRPPLLPKVLTSFPHWGRLLSLFSIPTSEGAVISKGTNATGSSSSSGTFAATCHHTTKFFRPHPAHQTGSGQGATSTAPPCKPNSWSFDPDSSRERHIQGKSAVLPIPPLCSIPIWQHNRTISNHCSAFV